MRLRARLMTRASKGGGGTPWGRRRLLLCIVALAVATNAAGAIFWTTSGRLPITGDEPHYLIIAASVLRDFDFDVSNNYREDATTHEIANALTPHALRRGSVWWPQHMPGLGVLLSIPFGLGGAPGARAALVMLLVAVLGITIYRWSLTFLFEKDAALVTLGAMVCSPVIFGATQLYPDLPGGVAIFALVAWVWGDHRRTRPGWCVYWLAAGLLCWLHVKYYAPSAVLAAIGSLQLWRNSARFTPATYFAFGVLFLAGPVLFGIFSVPAFGNMLGGRGGGELEPNVIRAVEIILGLHLDQIHGMFIQQPLLLPGLVGLGWMIRRRHPLTLLWLALYSSLIVPNALQRIPYGGHVAPAGRFGWSEMWLWLVPLAIFCRESFGRRVLHPGARVAVLAGVGYQIALAILWIPEPQRLFNGMFPADQWQPSLFPPDVMLSLPKLDPESLSYPPNLVGILTALSLLMIGLLPANKLRLLPAAATVVLALALLPVEDTLNRSRTFPRRYEAENTRARCTVVSYPSASNGQVCRQSTDRFAVAGPFISLNPGAYRAVAAVRGHRTSSRAVLEVVSGRGRASIARHDFQIPSSTHDSLVTVVVEFGIDRAHNDVEFRLRGDRGLEVDYIQLDRSQCLGGGSGTPVRVMLQASNEQFLVAENNGGGAVHANRRRAGPWERFHLVDANGGCLESGDEIFLRTSGNYYLRAERAGGSTMDATSTDRGEEERFYLHRRGGSGSVHSGDLVTLQTTSGHFVVATNGGGGAVRADGIEAGKWEQFRITAVAKVESRQE